MRDNVLLGEPIPHPPLTTETCQEPTTKRVPGSPSPHPPSPLGSRTSINTQYYPTEDPLAYPYNRLAIEPNRRAPRQVVAVRERSSSNAHQAPPSIPASWCHPSKATPPKRSILPPDHYNHRRARASTQLHEGPRTVAVLACVWTTESALWRLLGEERSGAAPVPPHRSA